ncbi:MAG: carbohydrate porin [Acidobacteriota bacterium]|nr:carbohydrate porin [Acidobacteriota bacterium]
MRPQDSGSSGKSTDSRGLSDRFWLGGQINLVAQGHGNFHALYSGTNSFTNQSDYAVTSIEDLFSGARVARHFYVLFDVEDVRGQGLSSVLGLAGFTDLDAQKAPSSGQQPHTYVSRILLHYVLPLGGKERPNDPSILELASHLPSRRLEIYFGKFSLADFFDQNDYANSSHYQFLNWATDQNGAWDYAANAPGYTYGAYLEFDDGALSLRYAEALMSRVPNGLYLSLHLSDTRAENGEIDWAYSRQTSGALRVLGYVDQAPMGSFADALAAWRDGLTPVPNTADVRRPGRHEYGFGLNWQQGLPAGFGLFARAGWNNGKYESYEYTEVNNTVEGGVQIPGELWRRPNDHAGIALVSNGISLGHRQYLAAGGLGFQLGDGALTYGRETIFETYYNLKLPIGLSLSPNLQFLENPGYNEVRGPVTVFSLRVNWDFGLHQLR